LLQAGISSHIPIKKQQVLWLARQAGNALKRFRRQEFRYYSRAEALVVMDEDGEWVEREIEDREASDALEAVLEQADRERFLVALRARLNGRERWVLAARLAGKTEAEIARALGISQPAVAYRLQKIRAKARAILAEILVVIAIVVLLASLVYPLYQVARYRASEARCRANLWAIYLKYKQLKTEYKVGTPEFKRAFMDWINRSPEAHAVIYCPLADYRLYRFNTRTMVPVRYVNLTGVRVDRLLTERLELVAFCTCHRQPPTTDCIEARGPEEKLLAVFDIGDGVVRYATWDEIRDWITDPTEADRLLREGAQERERMRRGE
jgi:DNA-binding CsgD family transcriptional regulator